MGDMIDLLVPLAVEYPSIFTLGLCMNVATCLVHMFEYILLNAKQWLARIVHFCSDQCICDSRQEVLSDVVE